jgi:hypothetical protein
LTLNLLLIPLTASTLTSNLMKLLPKTDALLTATVMEPELALPTNTARVHLDLLSSPSALKPNALCPNLLAKQSRTFLKTLRDAPPTLAVRFHAHPNPHH